MSRVDVLAVMDMAAGAMRKEGATYSAGSILEARDAVADLFDRVEARKRLRDEFREWSQANPGQPAPRDFMRRFTSSDDRVNSALARCRGGAA